MSLDSYILQQEDGRQANNKQQKSGLLDTGCGITEENFEKTDLIKDWKTLVKNLDDVDNIDSDENFRAKYGVYDSPLLFLLRSSTSFL